MYIVWTEPTEFAAGKFQSVHGWCIYLFEVAVNTVTYWASSHIIRSCILLSLLSDREEMRYPAQLTLAGQTDYREMH